MSLSLIKNALLIDPSQDLEGEYDLLIEDKLIKAVEPRGSLDHVKVDFTYSHEGMWLVPGLIDLHVHLRDPGLEWKENIGSGVRAAISGGYTSICAMPNTKPSNHSAEITKYMINKSQEYNLARVLPIGAISIDLKGKQMAPLSELFKAGCVAFSDDGEPIFDAGLMIRALEWTNMLNCRISCHEEDKNISCGGCVNESAITTKLGLPAMPTIAEDVMVARDIELARYTNSKIHICHISSARGVELVRRAKNDGIDVTCEVTPHHLVLNDSYLKDFDTNYKMSPPLRSEEERLALIKGLQDGTIDAIASDHAPHENDSKLRAFEEATFGILGLQTSLPLTLKFINDGTLSKLDGFRALSTNPASCFSLPYGSLKVGAPADMVVIDPKHKWSYTAEENLSKSFNSPFLNEDFIGKSKQVFVNGEIKLDNFELKD